MQEKLGITEYNNYLSAMKTVSICKFYLGEKFLGEAVIPSYSTREIRRLIAKAHEISQYDNVKIQDFEIGAAISEEKSYDFKTMAGFPDIESMPYGDNSLTGFLPELTPEDIRKNILSEADPI